MKRQKKPTVFCSQCGTELADKERTHPDVHGGKACHDCFTQAEETSSLFEKYDIDGSSQTCRLHSEFGNLTKRTPDFPAPVSKIFWVKTDGWRGHTDWELDAGYIKVGDGWIANFPDQSTQRKISLSKIRDKMIAKESKPPCPVYWLFGITSNLFSQASCVVIHENRKEDFAAWLKAEHGWTLEDLEEAFG
jgi:hypothetical protein